MENKLLDMIFKFFKKEDFPCLYEQYIRLSKTKPLLGVKVLNSTPIFKNFLPKLLPLIASGADLTIGKIEDFPFDQSIIDFVKDLRIPIHSPENNVTYDIILDCIGSKAHLPARIGYVELTQSGKQHYINHSKPCILVDEIKVKEIEDLLGTSDGFIRGMKKAGITNFTKKKVLLFGYGKVGKGIANRLTNKGADLTIIELKSKTKFIHDHKVVAADQIKTILEIVENSDIIVTATGISNLITNHYPVSPFLYNEKILVNMGAEDEYGHKFSDKQILNNKHPLNFSLPEPTKLVFLDPIFALHNECALDLISEHCKPGLITPKTEFEARIINILKKENRLCLDSL